MNTTLLIGTWRVEKFAVRGQITETPTGWAEFSFFDDGTVIKTDIRPNNHYTDSIQRRWWADGEHINIHQEGKLAWNIKYLTDNHLVLSQDNDAIILYLYRVTE